jgi:hypothetical protein
MAVGKIDQGGSWAVDGTPIYTPSFDNLQVDHESIQGEDTGRTEDGHAHIDWVLTDVPKVFLKWKFLTFQEYLFLKGLLQGREFTLTYPEGSFQAYCTKVSYTLVSTHMYESEGGLVRDVSANAIMI